MKLKLIKLNIKQLKQNKRYENLAIFIWQAQQLFHSVYIPKSFQNLFL